MQFTWNITVSWEKKPKKKIKKARSLGHFKTGTHKHQDERPLGNTNTAVMMMCDAAFHVTGLPKADLPAPAPLSWLMVNN